MPFENIEILPEEYVFPEPGGGPECIPRILHTVWVGTADMPKYAHENIAKWRELMPNWDVRLWTNADISEFPEIENKINETEKGVQKADILRYFVVEKYGGIYMDADVTPHRSLEPIIAMNRMGVACNDIPFHWAYCWNGFFAFSPHHPCMKSACEKAKRAIINTEDIHIKTGPKLFGDALVETCIVKGEHVMLPSKYLCNTVHNNGGACVGSFQGVRYYKNSCVDERFGTHEYCREWSV